MGFEPTSQLGPFCVEFVCCCRASERFLPQSKGMQVRLTGDSKLPVSVNVSVNVWALWLTGNLSREYPASLSMSAKDQHCQDS